MVDMKADSAQPPPFSVTTYYPPPASHRPRFFRLLVLLSAATTLTVLLPSIWTSPDAPWSPFSSSSPPAASVLSADPASEWEDNIWPLRPPTPWDISTDFPYPRKLQYGVTEGTWLRLDVHPKTGDIVFDMVGDIYCLDAAEYTGKLGSGLETTLARPVVLGAPHDSDPHFSPDGGRLVFRSDAGLGVENIWVTEWKGCREMDLRSESASGELREALQTKEEDEEMLAAGVREDLTRKRARLLREGRLEAQRVTNETYRWVSDARFHPSGDKVVATKWYTSGRSLGAGEGWEYDIPKAGQKIEVGSGRRLVGRTLPPGWGSEAYGDQQVGPEQFIWHGNDTVIYSKNVIDTNGQWAYSKDVHSGIYAIFQTNLTSKATTTLVSSFPGGASRPEISRDGRTLAFVRRVRDKQALVFKDLTTGTIHNIWHGLTYDVTTVSAPMGTYPSFAFSPSDDAVIIWAAGQIWHVPLSTNSRGERVSAGHPQRIAFRAWVEKRLAETRSTETDIVSLETADKQSVHAFTELRVNHDGSKVTFQGAGLDYVYDISSGHLKAVPVVDKDAPYHSPSFVPGAEDLVVHARWSDTAFTTFEIANITSGKAYELSGLPLGRYFSPVLCQCSGARRTLAFIKTGGDYLSGDIVATAGAGLYIADITLPSASSLSDTESLEVKNIRFVAAGPAQGPPGQTKIQFIEKNTKLLVQLFSDAFIIDLAAGPDAFGAYKQTSVASGKMSTELAVSVNPKHVGKAADVAFVDFFNVYYAPSVKADEAVWSKAGNSTKHLMRLGLDGGHDVIWSGDGKKVFWLLGPYLHEVEVHQLHKKCAREVAKDPLNFGVECTYKQLKYHKLTVDYHTDVYRLKQEAAALHADDPAAQVNADFAVFINARVLTMETGKLEHDLLHDAILVTKGGKIEAIVGIEDSLTAIPFGAKIIDVQGAFIVPGFIDVHAHWNGFETFHPARSWELETFLAYGVTTLHNPSADNVRGSWERFRVERGLLNGPRIFHVGNVIYGGAAPGIHQDVTTMEEAYSALIRIKAEGGPASFSYKNYNLPSRASRQRLLLAARNLSMLCVPEGGMNYDWDQTYIVDGMTTIEHPLPIPQLYQDVISLFALSGTGSTPTHIVNYGGVFGEQYVWATEDIPNDEKLRRFTRHDILESLSESTSRPKNSYAFFNTSQSTATMVHQGLRAHIGAHGEPPLGLNYHAEMYFTKLGGLSSYEVVRAATSDAAKTLGIWSAVGSLTPGKLADFVVFPPGFNVLEDDIRKTRNIRYVVRGGRIWEAETMVEVWPVKGRKAAMPPLNAE